MRHQLSASDVEPLTLPELLALADRDSLGRWESLSLGYTESSGLPALRDEIAHLYARIEPARVLVFSGAEEGIFLTMHALLRDPGDEAVVVTPAYQSLHSIAASIGATVRVVPLRFENSWQLDLDDVGRAVTRRTRVIVVNFPHNPTGAHITAETQRRLIAIAEDAGAVLFSDEVYRGLEYNPGDQLPAAADLSEHAVSLGVMSKSYALAGLRIGWLATRNEGLLDQVARLKDYTSICASAPSEVLALIGLRARERLLQRSRGIVLANLAHARDFFDRCRRHAGWIAPSAGSVAFPRFTSLDAEVVSSGLAQRESVLLMPGRVFGAATQHFRLGLGRRDFPEALARLESTLQ